MKTPHELLGNAIGIVVALCAASLIIGILLRTGSLVPWQLWGAIVAAITFMATLVVSLWWYDRWRGKQ